MVASVGKKQQQWDEWRVVGEVDDAMKQTMPKRSKFVYELE
jgi:hypothetical protein